MLKIKNNRIIIKVGSRILFDNQYNQRLVVIESIVEQISFLIKKGYQVIFVSSGAVMSGRSVIDDNFLDKGSLASVGQVINIGNYAEMFFKHGIYIGQMLFNKADSFNTEKIKNSFNGMLGKNIVPIVNQNDPCINVEDDFIDNDELSLYLAKLLDIGLMFFLTDVDGVLTALPPENGEIIHDVYLNDDVLKFVKSSNPGGMNSKIRSSVSLSKIGIPAYITNGMRPNSILDAVLFNKLNGTFFHTE